MEFDKVKIHDRYSFEIKFDFFWMLDLMRSF